MVGIESLLFVSWFGEIKGTLALSWPTKMTPVPSKHAPRNQVGKTTTQTKSHPKRVFAAAQKNMVLRWCLAIEACLISDSTRGSKMVVSDLFFLSFVKNRAVFLGLSPIGLRYRKLPTSSKGCLKYINLCRVFKHDPVWKDPVCLLWIIDDAFVYSEVSVRW